MREVIKTCLFCNIDFSVPYYNRDIISTCSRYCGNRIVSLHKMNGSYVQCSMCDKAIYKEKSKIKNKNFCNKNCLNEYVRKVEPLNETKKLLNNRKKYYGSNWGVLTRKVRDEQNYTCSDRGIEESSYGKSLSVHHIIPFITFDTIEEANNRSNLVGLCEPCHRKRHSGEGHIRKLNTSDLGKNANSDYGVTTYNQKKKAESIVELLLHTDLTLKDISVKLNVAYATVRRIYKGERWSEFYSEPPYKTNPRAKSN